MSSRGLPRRDALRNVAIVAHVDHGKTTLVDAMLRQTGAFRANQEVADRVMDSMDLEREKGITILAKNTAVRYGDVKINIVDTPGHADFGGEVERGLTMVDGVLLLVDASEGPLPQTRFVLRKTLEARLPVILVVNKVDRSDARVAEVVHEVEELFLDLDADEHQIDFPIVYCNARDGPRVARRRRPRPASRACAGGSDGLKPLFELLLDHIPAPGVRRRRIRSRRWSPTSTRRRTSGASRCAACATGTLRKGQPVAWCRADGTIETVAHHRALRDRGARPGRRRARWARARSWPSPASPTSPSARRSPIPTTRARFPVIHVDDPSLSMTIGINTSPLSGQDGTKLTARQVKSRLDAELVGNVSLRVLPTDRPDAWEVQGRGELQLAVLVEMMRREGFELTVGKPEVVTREVNGKVHEPVEHVTIDVPEDYLGVVTQLLALRKGRMEQMVNHGTGWVRMEYLVPARGLIGFRTEFMTETRGTGMLAPRVRALRAVARRAAHAPDGQPRVGPARLHQHVRAHEPPGARADAGGPGRRGVRGDDRRGERPLRRHGREPHQGEEAHQHARGAAPTTPSAWCRRGRCRSSRRSSSSPTTSASR